MTHGIRTTKAQPSPAHTLGNDDDKPVIPRIPGPRKPGRATAPLPQAALDAITRLDRALHQPAAA